MTKRLIGITGLMLVSTLWLPDVMAGQLPVRSYTPGATTRVDVKRLCAAEFDPSATTVAKWQREQALTRYGIRAESFGGELDRLIPVSLGGSNDPDNLFPFRASGEYTLEAKNQLADRLHELVCDGKMSLKEAQDAFRKDWTKAYKQYLRGMNAPGY